MVPSNILEIQTFTYGIFRTWLGMGDLTGALRLAVLLMAFTLLVLFFKNIPDIIVVMIPILLKVQLIIKLF